MKKIWSIIGVMILLLSCSRVERIQSLSQLEPTLRKHIGNPSKIDTVYPNEYTPNGSIIFQYEDTLNISFTQLVTFFSETYNHKPQLVIENKRQVADFILETNDNSFKTEVLEYYGSKDNKRNLYIIAIDVNNELVTPSSQTLQTSALSK